MGVVIVVMGPGGVDDWALAKVQWELRVRFQLPVTNPPDTLVSKWHGCGVQGWLNVAQSCSQEDWLRETSGSCYWGTPQPLDD